MEQTESQSREREGPSPLQAEERVQWNRLKGFGQSREREREDPSPFQAEKRERIHWNRMKGFHTLHSALNTHRTMCLLYGVIR